MTIQTTAVRRFDASIGDKGSGVEVSMIVTTNLTVDDDMTTITSRNPARVELMMISTRRIPELDRQMPERYQSRTWTFTPRDFAAFADLVRDASVAIAGLAAQEDQR